MSANVPRQYSSWTTCSAAGATTHTPGFDYSYVFINVGKTSERQFYTSLTGAATTNDWAISTGPLTLALQLPSVSNVFSYTCTASGAEVSFTLLR